MTDQCKFCQQRGNIKGCLSTDCGKHNEDWIGVTLKQNLYYLLNKVGVDEDGVYMPYGNNSPNKEASIKHIEKHANIL